MNVIARMETRNISMAAPAGLYVTLNINLTLAVSCEWARKLPSNVWREKTKKGEQQQQQQQ